MWRATYRVQLHAGFGFKDAADVTGYLADLGVSHLYCSPYLQAAPGSTHGYDVVDPTKLNDELGGSPGFASLVGALHEHGLGQILDIVPNHMATETTNRFWWDVLENGPASRYAPFFDIDWHGDDDKSAFTVLVPVLGDHYGRVLEAGDLRIERRGGTFTVRYYEHELPVSPRTLDELLTAASRRAGSPPLAELGDGFAALPPARLADADAVAERHDRKLALTAELERLCGDDPALAAAVDAEVDAVNRDPDRLDHLLRRQNYRLARWRVAREELDYRRFFNIETLVGVRVEDPDVFETTHALVLDLVADGTVEGLRIDHVDGLRDPQGYLERLAARASGAYTVVEKILEAGERLPSAWPVAGTSGYDFLNRVNYLFVDRANEAAMTASYVDFTGEAASYDDVVYDAKQQIMGDDLAAEVERVTRLLADICDHHRRHLDHTRRELRDALREVVAHFPVYRTYIRRDGEPSSADRAVVEHAVSNALVHRPELDHELVTFIGEVALGDHDAVEFALRLQQLTAPVMAKGTEDTAFYRYHRLVSLNEVGGDPGTFGRSVDDFHADTAASAEQWPRAMLTLSTHDTKRSADVRARLNVLSELPDEWRAAVDRWAHHNARHRLDDWPDANTEYLLYQTLVGAWPIDAGRAVAFMAKATKEAKVHTSWTDADVDYDRAVETFTRALLADATFVEAVERFLVDHHIVERGHRNSLAQTALLLTCPGVPDIYQGTELWDFSLVDPDNRRPVDFDVRRRALAAGTREQPKLWMIHRLLDHRRRRPDLYATAAYEPLPAEDDVVAFTRGDLAVVAPRRGLRDWRQMRVGLPRGDWRDVLGDFPVGVLARERN